jgi:hypothetical protein
LELTEILAWNPTVSLESDHLSGIRPPCNVVGSPEGGRIVKT